MCNVVAPMSSSSTTSTPTSSTAITSSSTPTPTPEVLFPFVEFYKIWKCKLYKSFAVFMFNDLTGAWVSNTH